uniref:RING-type E3 ubiquitin transferase n=1 Tax=Cyprinus carpio TaxID=7962 RepID=A0A8C2JGU6_CYPCA
ECDASATRNMAESAAPRQRFFCHCCRAEIDPKLPEYVCPRCESGFIEEVSENSNRDGAGAAAAGADDMASQFAEVYFFPTTFLQLII